MAQKLLTFYRGNQTIDDNLFIATLLLLGKINEGLEARLQNIQYYMAAYSVLQLYSKLYENIQKLRYWECFIRNSPGVKSDTLQSWANRTSYFFLIRSNGARYSKPINSKDQKYGRILKNKDWIIEKA